MLEEDPFHVEGSEPHIEEPTFFVEDFNKNKTYKGLNSFDCGDTTINKYAKENLRRQGGRDNVKILLLVDNEDNIIGFVTATIFQLSKEIIPPGVYSYALPPRFGVIKIPMIAVDKQYQKQGWGEQLVHAAFEYVLDAAAIVPDIKGAYLDAITTARAFYEDFDFKVLDEKVSENGTLPMFISIDTLRSFSSKK